VRILIALLGMLLAVQSSTAQIVSSGGYTFYIDAVNSRYQNVNHARASVQVSGSTAYVTVRADGYRDGRATIYLRESQKTYRERVRLDDPTIFFTIRDHAGQRIQSYVDQNQFGAWGDEYRFEVRLSEDGFTKFTRTDVDVRVNHMTAWGERIYIKGSGERRRVEVTIKRRDLRSFSNRIEVQLPRDSELSKSRKIALQSTNYQLLNGEELELSAEQVQELETVQGELKTLLQ